MNTITTIPIRKIQNLSAVNNNVRTILIEIQQALDDFYKTGSKQIIDLVSLPLDSFEKDRLLELLGRGEVYIRLSTLGESEIYETEFACVWLVKHHDELGEISGLLIEISEVPDIVLSKKDEIKSQTNELNELINNA